MTSATFSPLHQILRSAFIFFEKILLRESTVQGKRRIQRNNRYLWKYVLNQIEGGEGKRKAILVGSSLKPLFRSLSSSSSSSSSAPDVNNP